MFRALILPIFRSTRPRVTACRIRQHRGCIIPQAVTKSSAPEDGRDQRPKHVELIGIINKLLLLHLVGVYIIYIEMGLETGWSRRFSLKKSASDKLFSQIPHNETNVFTKCHVPHSSIKIVTKQQAKYVYPIFQTYSIWIFHE